MQPVTRKIPFVPIVLLALVALIPASVLVRGLSAGERGAFLYVGFAAAALLCARGTLALYARGARKRAEAKRARVAGRVSGDRW